LRGIERKKSLVKAGQCNLGFNMTHIGRSVGGATAAQQCPTAK
jgi:hypothetical protein